jgi:tRNA pseudouridine55 synthase
MNELPLHGLLVIDKPTGLTSRQAVNQASHWLPRRTRLGHTGTLDPLATGVLVLCVGVATRLADYVQRLTKMYHAVIRLGAQSDTDDADGTVTPVNVARPPTADEVASALNRFVGEIDQVPPKFSATRVMGRRAYDLSRRGKEIDLQPRRVRVDRIDLLDYSYPQLEIAVTCGKGTYIRSQARDLGLALGCGGLITALRRTQVGPFTADNALSLDADATTARSALRPLADALVALPRVAITDAEVERLRHGLAIDCAESPAESGELAVFDTAGRLVAVARIDASRQLQPIKVLPP